VEHSCIFSFVDVITAKYAENQSAFQKRQHVANFYPCKSSDLCATMEIERYDTFRCKPLQRLANGAPGWCRNPD